MYAFFADQLILAYCLYYKPLQTLMCDKNVNFSTPSERVLKLEFFTANEKMPRFRRTGAYSLDIKTYLNVSPFVDSAFTAQGNAD